MRYIMRVAAASPKPSYLKHFRLHSETLAATKGWEGIDRQRVEGVWGASLRDLHSELFDEPADQQAILRMFLAANWVMKTCCGTTVVRRMELIQHITADPDEEGEA